MVNFGVIYIFRIKTIAVLMAWIACLLAAHWPIKSLAREWYIQPSVNFRTLYDDNIRLFTDQLQEGANIDVDAFGFITSAGAKMGVATDRLDVAFNVEGVINRYTGDLDLDSEDVFLDLKSAYFVTERNIFGLNAKYIKDTTLSSELDTTDFFQENVPRQLWSIDPNWIYSLSELMSLQLNYSHVDVSYKESDPERFRFFDYTTDYASISFIHQWNSSLSYNFVFGALLFEVPEQNQKTRDYNINAGLDYQFSETWTGSFMVGVRRTTAEFIVFGQTLEDSSFGPLFSISTEKLFETASIAAGYSRSTKPTGTGEFVVVDRFDLDYQQRLSERFRIILNASYNNTQRSGQVEGQDRSFYIVEPKVSWLINRQANLTASYRFRLRETDRADSTATSNAFLLTLSYTWDKFSTREF